MKGMVNSMALRNIREIGDEILTKRSKEVKEMTPKTRQLIEDMLETMYTADGVGLAAPQVGILKRIAVVDITEEQNDPIILINPSVIYEEGEQRGSEGCLSVPGKAGIVTRPNFVRVRALDLDMNEVEYEGEELLARALVHEIDHLEGKLYVDMVEGDLVDVGEMAENE